jgi:DNA-directed RNA polymerase subunit RPC12/RpoP
MERVDAQCRKCSRVFSTAAQTRTTCPYCKAAVTVRRDDSSYERPVEAEIDALAFVVVLGVVGIAWAGWRTRKWWTGRKGKTDDGNPDSNA